MGTETKIIPMSYFLNNSTAIEAKLSDHNVVIRGRTLFFNMMMQGRWNSKKHRYNNGFARIESDAQYQSRIKDVVSLLAEMLAMNPHIMFVGLAEAPIKTEDIACVITEAKKHKSLTPFLPSFIESNFTSMGIATFINYDYFDAYEVPQDPGIQASLKDRVQTFEVIAKDCSEHFELVTLHLPYDIAKSRNPKKLLDFSKALFSKATAMPALVMGDFNIYPKTIAKALMGVVFYIQSNNNLLVRADEYGVVTHREYDTVDAIFQSVSLAEKQRVYSDARTCPNAGVSLTLAHRLFASSPSNPRVEAVKVEELDDSQTLLTL